MVVGSRERLEPQALYDHDIRATMRWLIVSPDRKI
jgi:hypothetical protein